MNTIEALTMPKQETISNFHAVAKLLDLARKDCGGSKAAASVLLCAYNIYDYELDIGELCRLDPQHYQSAMMVIDLRCRQGIEPHELIHNGDTVFQELAKHWAHLRKKIIH